MKTTTCETILITLFYHAPSSKGSQMKGKKCVHLNYGFFFQACFQKGFDPIQYIAKCCNLLKRIKGHVLIGFEIYSS